MKSVVVLIAAALGACGDDGPHVRLTAAPPCTPTREPQQIARAAQCPQTIALDDDYVYWTDSSSLVRMKKCGTGEPPELLMSNVYAYELAVDDEAVYLTNGGQLLRMSLHDGVVKTLSADTTVDQLWVGGEFVYVAGQSFVPDGSSTSARRIWRLPRRGGDSQTVLAGDFNGISDLVGDGENIYYSSYMPSLGRVPASGGDSVDLVPDSGELSDYRIVTDGAYVYYMATPGLRRVPTGGGDSQPVATVNAGSAGLAIDDDYIYWSTYGGGFGSLFRAEHDGGGRTQLAGGHDFLAIAVDRGAAYFSSCENGENTGIWIVAK